MNVEGSYLFHERTRLSCSNLVYGMLMMEGICSVKFFPFGERSTELRMHGNRVSSFQSNYQYSNGVVFWLTWPFDTLLYVLILLETNMLFLNPIKTTL